MKNEYDLITQNGRMVNRVCFLTSAFAPSALRPCACKVHFSRDTCPDAPLDTSPDTSKTPPGHLLDTPQTPPRHPQNIPQDTSQTTPKTTPQTRPRNLQDTFPDTPPDTPRHPPDNP